jgi:hypothetical protein
MKKLLPLVFVLACGCGSSSSNPLLGDWLAVDEPGSALRVTDREMIYMKNGKTETNRYSMVSPTEVTLFREGESMTFKVEVTANSLKMQAPNGTRTFKRK